MKRFTALVLISAATLCGCEASKSEPVASSNVADCPAATRRPAPEMDLTKFPDELLEPSGPGLWIGGAPFTRSMVRNAHQGVDQNGSGPVVRIYFNENGRQYFRCIQEGRVGKLMEVSYDGVFLTRPILHEIIDGGDVEIPGLATVEQANALVEKLNQGKR